MWYTPRTFSRARGRFDDIQNVQIRPPPKGLPMFGGGEHVISMAPQSIPIFSLFCLPDKKERIMVLKQADLFADMEPEVIDKIKKIMIDEFCEEGTVLFERGEFAGDLYILKQGRVELAIGENGHVTYVVKKPGEAFGWSSLVNHHVYTASAICSSPAELIRIQSDKLNAIFEGNPASGLTFFRRLAEIISKRVATSYNLLLRSHNKTSRYLRIAGSI